MSPRLALLVLLFLASHVRADGPTDNSAEKVRQVPPPGATVSAEDRTALQSGLAELAKAIQAAADAQKGKPALLDLLPDVEVYAKAVRYALENDELYVEKKGRDDIKVAKATLAAGMKRAAELKAGTPSWPGATGLVVRGYRSKIDGSVQPYGLVVPESFAPKSPYQFRADFWWHGRGETLTELDFIRQRQSDRGQFTPENAFVVHPYGRFCNANKFAGEIDTLEVLEHLKKHYPIDEQRLVARGFSMGGASCWQFAAHYPTLWCAAAPGAGFAETPEFLNVFQNEKLEPTWYEKKLWHLYNASDTPYNFLDIPTVAYSGEKDKQKQAADVMAREMAKAKIELVHVIGKGAGHAYTPAGKAEVNAKIDALAARGKPRVPKGIYLETYTLRYNKAAWLEITGLEKHWEKATVNAFFTGPNTIEVNAVNVTGLRLNFGPGEFPLEGTNWAVKVAPKELLATYDRSNPAVPRSDQSFTFSLGKSTGPGTAKKPGLQGPIDDAFMSAFLMVEPTGTPMNEALGKWTDREMKHAATQWRKVFRGDAPTKKDTDVTEADIAANNLVLWGDPKSNAILAKIADRLPLNQFSDSAVTTLIYPNPLNPDKYVVLNSGVTFREYDQLNNARQVPKLPDYAVIDITTPTTPRAAGKVVRAGFFNEQWKLLPTDGR
jgi:dienelactone hydrolase